MSRNYFFFLGIFSQSRRGGGLSMEDPTKNADEPKATAEPEQPSGNAAEPTVAAEPKSTENATKPTVAAENTEPKQPTEPKATAESAAAAAEKKNDFLVKLWKTAEGDNQKFLAFLHVIPARSFERDDVLEVMKIEAIDAACRSYIWHCLLMSEVRHGSVAVVKECIDGIQDDIRSLLVNSNRDGAYRHCKDALVRSTGKEFDARHDRFVASTKPILDFITSAPGVKFHGIVVFGDLPFEQDEQSGEDSKRERGDVRQQEQKEATPEAETSSKRQKKEDE